MDFTNKENCNDVGIVMLPYKGTILLNLSNPNNEGPIWKKRIIEVDERIITISSSTRIVLVISIE
jgi:hypothetical protein